MNDENARILIGKNQKLELQLAKLSTAYDSLTSTGNELLANKKKLVRELEIWKSTSRLISDKLDKAHATAARQCTNIIELSSKYDERRDRVVHLESLLEASKKQQTPFADQERMHEMQETIVELEASCDRYQEQLDSYRSQPVRGSSTAANPAQDDWRTKSIMDPFLHVDPSNSTDFTAIEAWRSSAMGVPSTLTESTGFHFETPGGNPAIQENLDVLKSSLGPHGSQIHFCNLTKETPMSNSTCGSAGNSQPQPPIFQTKNFIYGSDIETLTNDNIINVIQNLESELKQLNSMQTPSKVRTAMVEEITDSIAKIVAVLDSRSE